jgi:hypothetical protein
VWATNAGCKEGGPVANVLPSKIIVPVANAEDGEEGGDDGFHCPGSAEDSHMEGREGGGITIVVGRSKQRHRTMTYSAILIVGGITVASAAAQLLLLQLQQWPRQLRPLTGAGRRRTTSMKMRGGGRRMTLLPLPARWGGGGGGTMERTLSQTSVPVTDPPPTTMMAAATMMIMTTTTCDSCASSRGTLCAIAIDVVLIALTGTMRCDAIFPIP